MVTRNIIITSISVFLLALLIIFMYKTQEENWKERVATERVLTDALRLELKTKDSLIQIFEAEQNLKIKSVYSNYYDAYDEKGYRIYGLYKAPQGEYSVVRLARMFNVENPTSIKVSTVLGKDWFIVPIKGTHFLKKGETPIQLAKMYYHNPKDVELLQKMNPKWEAGRHILIPFN